MREGLRILLIEDDVSFRSSVIELVGVYNDVKAVGDMAAARAALGSQNFDVVLLDLSLPDGHGLPLIREIKSEDCNVVVLVLTGDGDFNTVKKCIEAGADDYVVKSERIVPDLLVRIPVAVSRGAKDRHAASLEGQFERVFKQELVGRSLAMAELREAVSSFASTDSAVLITGESGTGKENIARRLHHLKGASRPFVAVNCGAIPENLVESQLFGHKKGAFTGATEDHHGFFARAHGGDLFLDEVGELPLLAQVKLLRVLQDKVYFKVGGDRPIETNCRVIAATNQDLEELVNQKKFRKDLYYRLNIIRIKTTSLRERKDDIRDLSQFLLLKCAGNSLSLAPSAMSILEKHDWPGNIRELENTIVRAKHLAQNRKSKQIEAVDIVLDSMLSESSVGLRCLEAVFPVVPEDLTPERYFEFLAMAEREYLRTALELSNGRAEVTAHKLGLHRGTLYKKISQYGLSKRAPGSQESIPATGLRRAIEQEPIESVTDSSQKK
jgi:DNA-binding NtrC family response regulator